MWLAQIRLTPAMKREYPEEVSNLLEYQLNAADVLHEAFYETEEQKEALHNDLAQGMGGKEHEKRTHDGNRMERNYERSLQESLQRHDHRRSGSNRKIYRFILNDMGVTFMDVPGLAF